MTPVAASAKWKAYPAHKPSGVEWLGEIPAHWPVFRLKFLATVRASNVDKKSVEGDQPRRLCNYVDVYYHDHITEGIEFMPATASPDQIERFSLQRGDVIVTKDSESWTDIAVAAFVPNELEGVVCGYHLALVRPAPELVDGAYLFRAFAASGIRDQFHVAANGITRYGLSKYAIDNAVFPVPPLSEQRAIAAFLDRETAKIDALVAKKERLIALLQEKRTALLTHAVTKGLNPSVPMKASGIEWLDQIPQPWEVAPIYARYDVALGKMLDAKQITGNYLAPYLRNVDVQWDRVSVEDLPEMDFSAEERVRFCLQPGDLLVCEGGEVGRTAMWKGELTECYYQKAIHRLRPLRVSDYPRFFFFVMYAAAHGGIFVAGSNPNTIDHLTAVKLRHYRFPFPPLDEQESIASYLDGETAKIDALIGKVHEHTEGLKEYREAVISAAVTGKIDVREAAG